MGDPTDPGEDQETTIIIEGPSEGATPDEINTFNQNFESFKKEMSDVLHKWHKTKLKARLKKIVYVKKKEGSDRDD